MIKEIIKDIEKTYNCKIYTDVDFEKQNNFDKRPDYFFYGGSSKDETSLYIKTNKHPENENLKIVLHENIFIDDFQFKIELAKSIKAGYSVAICSHLAYNIELMNVEDVNLSHDHYGKNNFWSEFQYYLNNVK